MPKHLRYPRYAHFLPGLMILCFGMVALHTSVRLWDNEKKLEQHHSMMIMRGAKDDYGYGAARDELTAAELSGKLEKLHVTMYWSVIAISLSGFLLLILNADKLRRLQKLDEERNENLRLLEYRSAAVEASLEGIAIVDSDGNITFMNNALMELHGIRKIEKGLYLGKSWLNLYTPKGRDQIHELVLPELHKHGFWRGSSPIVKQGGEIVYADMSLTLLRDGGFIGTARDVTAQEHAAREKRDMLEQLHQAQKMEAIGRLAGGIAHDFNNILAAMNGYAEFLTEDLDPKTKQHGFAANILQAGRQARALVDKILAFSRRSGSDQSPMDLKTPLNETLSMLKASLPKSIELITDIHMIEAPIKGSASQIAQVIMNLCVNAKDALDNEKGKITIGLKEIYSEDISEDWLVDHKDPAKTLPIRIDEISTNTTRLRMGELMRDQDYIQLSVEDTGSGMSRKILERALEPFFTTKPVDKGTGLGLSTVHGVIAAHEGAMEIHSTIAHGTRFEIYFPKSMEVADRLELVPRKITANGGGMILLIEDQTDVRLMTTTMLERLGYACATAENGLVALDMIREKPYFYDLVLTDQNMPKMTGLELVYEVHHDFPNLPFILLSGYSEECLQELMAAHPAIKAVLRKPIAREALGQALEQVIKENKSLKSKVA